MCLLDNLNNRQMWHSHTKNKIGKQFCAIKNLDDWGSKLQTSPGANVINI
jgi:hypothetical protein